MSWSTDFYSAATGGTFAGSFAMEYMPDAVTPFAKYQLISSPGIDDLSGAYRAGARRVQVTTWADSPTDAEVEALKIATAIVNSSLDLESMDERSLGRDSTGVFGYAIDYIVWFDTP